MVLGIRYLTGYCVARDLTRQEAEWPPHPARVFMAMAATHFETGADPEEREALLWLENQPPPHVFASDGAQRSNVETYVPVNDCNGGILKRARQSRSFPAVRPDSDSVYLFWTNEPVAELRSAIERLCAKVTRIGHSSSLTQMWVSEEQTAITPNWQPADLQYGRRLRVPEKGLLQYLERSFNGDAIQEYFRLTDEIAGATGKHKLALKTQLQQRFQGVLPQAAKPIVTASSGYRQYQPDSAAKTREYCGPFGPNFIVLHEFESPTLGLESTLQLTLALRNALLKVCPQPQPEWLTGHAPDGSPSKHPHIAFFPLPFVGRQHADGHIMGLGIAIPKELAGESRPTQQALRECFGPLFYDPKTNAPREQLKLWKNSQSGDGKVWEWFLKRELREDPPRSLKPATWTGPSICWASVTPVVLHHFPKKSYVDDVERILRDAFKSALLPEPVSIQISQASAHIGAGSIRDVPAFAEGNGFTRYSTHVVATFSHPVTGPMLVGRGRFRGYGLFRPYRKEEAK
jgi:CRISPR-associated protein Csb2